MWVLVKLLCIDFKHGEIESELGGAKSAEVPEESGHYFRSLGQTTKV